MRSGIIYYSGNDPEIRKIVKENQIFVNRINDLVVDIGKNGSFIQVTLPFNLLRTAGKKLPDVRHWPPYHLNYYSTFLNPIPKFRLEPNVAAYFHTCSTINFVIRKSICWWVTLESPIENVKRVFDFIQDVCK